MTTQTEENQKHLGQLVTRAYRALGYSRQRLAPKVGVSDRTLFAIENGQSRPRTHTQQRLEEALGWRQGAIAHVLSVDSGTDLEQISVTHLQQPDPLPIAPAPSTVRSDESPIHRLHDAVADVAVLIRDKDRRIAELEAQIRKLQAG